MPPQLASLALQNRKIIYGLLLRASAETLRKRQIAGDTDADDKDARGLDEIASRSRHAITSLPDSLLAVDSVFDARLMAALIR